jgi:hypothetical protein
MPKRAEKVLYDALHAYRERGWDEQAVVVEDEINSMLGKAEAAVAAQAAQKRAAEATAPAHPNLMFRKEFKWKGKKS